MTQLARTSDGTPMLGDNDRFVPLTSVDRSPASIKEALSVAAVGELSTLDEATANPISKNHLAFSSPLEQFGKLWGIGLNYEDHASDLNETRPTEPASFMKPSTTAIGPGGMIRLPPSNITDRVTAEAELAVVIGRTCRDIKEQDADDVIAGYMPVIDMTAEDILERNPRFLTRSKSFDSFLVLGSSIVTTDAVGTLADRTVKTVVNGEVAAENTIHHMMTSPHKLVSFHSESMTLEPGDVILTGTPGAKHIRSGDSVRSIVEGIGSVSAEVVQ